jgi:putative addiction module killer protein
VIDVRETPDFTSWLAALSDQRARLQIVRRISRVAAETSAMPSRSVARSTSFASTTGRDTGFITPGKAVVILLCGGDRRTQSKDIRKAKEIAETLED